MMTHWQQVNQRYLATAIARIRQSLQRYIAQQQDTEPEIDAEPEDLAAIAATLPTLPALEKLTVAFQLTSFERDILVLCAGVELSASLGQLCSIIHSSPQLAYPTFSLALAALPESHWSALTPAAPLRRWRLIEVSNGESLTQSRIRIDERVLHDLVGISYLDDRLQGWVTPISVLGQLPPSHRSLAEQMAKQWSDFQGSILPVIQLCNREPGNENAFSIAAAACALLGLQLYSLAAAAIPAAIAEREALARLWEREALLNPSVLLIDCAELDRTHRPTVLSFVETLQSIVILTRREPLQLLATRGIIYLDVNPLSTTEQLELWQTALGTVDLNGQLEGLVSQFKLNPLSIQSVCASVYSEDSPPESDRLWDACRQQSRSRLDDLAQSIRAIATWQDLVLPDPQLQLLREIVAQVRQRIRVYETWEFAVRGSNGLGISALFAGASGTGKTLAAEVLAHELRLDLYRIDLSQVVSKYIGETEKNLRQVFDAAEASGAILLFDEADALFGKRSEVKDSHDRYANIEVSYLLQKMESYRGLAILTTNLKNAIDSAFLRRIRFVVQFPFPDAVQRIAIWQGMFSPKLPTIDLDFTKLARLNITGGNIRNIALNAAFLAANDGESLQMKHLLQAAQGEYAKLEKPFTEVEMGGWL
ncbi:ATP-binding protein [Nostoc sp. C052]|uniref:ATP-binding protein n=1 Tax=Nostoc sp. C052 TaxID=2576902 RepID=UPI0015C3A719|nr:ATP-binding protein [Nostoc sp. C052]QLE44373.1 ATP-binding protein [Nostoc sp. C052]